jgi:hypothetical protein
MQTERITRPADTVALVNISSEKWPPRQRSYFGSLQILSPEAGEPFAITPIRPCIAKMDLGDKRVVDVSLTAREIAEDIARELNGDSGEGSFHGVFVAAGDAPTDAELADARHRLQEFQRKLVASADLEWERTRNPMFITDLERRAARQLGLEKPWLYDPKPLAECPACGEKIKHGVAVCRACGAILDKEKAAQFGLGLTPSERPRKHEKDVGASFRGCPPSPENAAVRVSASPAATTNHETAKQPAPDSSK